eukprot:3005887-Rhodomonas_salina.1
MRRSAGRRRNGRSGGGSQTWTQWVSSTAQTWALWGRLWGQRGCGWLSFASTRTASPSAPSRKSIKE